MKKTLLVLAALPCFCFALQQTKEPSLRIETLHPDGTKTVREMVPSSRVKTERLAPKNAATPTAPLQQLRAPQLAKQANSSGAASPILSEKQHYLALIIAKIQQNWFVDDTMRGKECRINMKLAPDGSVTSVTPVGGDYNLCMSSLKAIKKAGNFPMSKNPLVYDALKDLTPILRPELR
jgi:colicin import membrane protein